MTSGRTPPIESPAGLSLTTHVSQVRGVGPRTAGAFERVGLRCVADLILHLPGRYEQQKAERSIEQLYIEYNRSRGDRSSHLAASGEIAAVRFVPGRKNRLEATLDDGTGVLRLVWFNMPWMREKIHPGLAIRVTGKPTTFGEYLQLTNPRFELADAEEGGDDGREPVEQSAASGNDVLLPVYPASEDLTPRQVAKVIDQVLDPALALIDDHLPVSYRRERALPELADSYRMVHRPDTTEDAKAGRRRLAFDELLLFQLGVMLKRHQRRQVSRAPALRHTKAIEKHILARFPFTLTRAQRAVLADLRDDLTGASPMNRLLQGDVGSGKTVVALYAMLLAVASEHQAALMAPTELLAEQHFDSIGRMLEGGRVRIELLTGSMSASARQAILDDLAAGEIDIIIGTHALLTESVRFSSLAVAVIDEQHRFGVHQRAALRTKTTQADDVAADHGAAGAGDSSDPSPEVELSPHVLVMTATPIPRTLAQTLLGDLDVSTIRGLPPGRQPILTRHVTADQSDEVYDYLRRRVDAGEQAYVVVPAVEAGEQGLADVTTHAERLRAGPLAGRAVAVLHGRINRDERRRVMDDFRAGRIDVLVATTVIEVGVDVPNATMMVVEHADRFGLAQLHQLRGRIGRGERPSLCVLIGDPVSDDGTARINAMVATNDGFVIAEKDLEIRGPGELFGWRQSGEPPFRVARLNEDQDLLALARRDARQWIENNPTMAGDELALLRKRLLKAYGRTFGLVDVA